MTSNPTLLNDPVLAILPTVRGRKVLHPCVLYARLGRGGMGAVFLAKHLTLRQRQVVKCLWLMGCGGHGEEQFVERFQQEARIAAGMTHQNLVRVTHIDRLGELHYLVMEHVEGEDVDRFVKRRGPLDEAEALQLLHGAALGLGYAHARGIVHRDVKPANLMLSARGEVKVIDLGLARPMQDQQQLLSTIGTIGTPLYMAPEQWDSSTVGPTADVWALGACLYFVLAGRTHVPKDVTDASALRRFVTEHPFPDLDAESLPVDATTRRILQRCVARDPAERYPDARALAADLAPLCRRDDALAGLARAPGDHGDEPDDAELAALREALRHADATPAPVAQRPPSPPASAAPLDATLVFRPEAPTVASGIGATPTPPTPVPPIASAAVTRAAAAATTRSRWPLAASLATAVALAATAGVVAWPRIDADALQREAMAAIYQQRFDEAERLLLRLEQVPAFADQARRLRIDARLEAASRHELSDPFVAMADLRAAADIVPQLRSPKDAEEAQRRIATARDPLAASLTAQLAAAIEVASPSAGARITRSREPVRVRVRGSALPLRVSVDGHALTAGADDELHGAWRVPDADGPQVLRLVVEETRSGLQHTLSVPVDVARGLLALQLDETPAPTRADVLALRATVHGGPSVVQCRVVRPDGKAVDRALGERDGGFAFTVPNEPGLDGDYLVQLHAVTGGREVTSIERRVRVDRTPPRLSLPMPTIRTAAATLVLRGTADEPCRVTAVGGDDATVATDAGGTFSLAVTLPPHDGAVVFSLQARDTAGNELAAPATITVVVDRSPPHIVSDTLRFAARTREAEVELHGRLDEAGSVAVDDTPPVSTDATGAFSVRAKLPPGALEQVATLRLVARDLAGNAAPSHLAALFVDRSGPAILPAAPDGSWWAGDRWMLRVEDISRPCQVTLGGETRTTAADGRVDFPLRSQSTAITVVATDSLGNESRRELASPRPGNGDGGKALPGPAWGTPVDGSTLDPDSNLYERVALPIGDQRLAFRLVRPLRDDELPPARQLDRRALALLQGSSPFYLSETEVSVAQWGEFAPHDTSAPVPHRVFDPRDGRCHERSDADWRTPLHPDLLVGRDASERADWPVTQVTPEQARAFCARYGLRLPTEAEWLFVVRMGTNGRYGWGGSAPLELRANLADLGLQVLAPGLTAFEPVEDGFATLAPVGAFPRDPAAHPWGFRCLLGNVAEWVVTAGDHTVARGGSWLSEPRDLRVDELRQDGLVTRGAWDHVGFRVVREP